MEVTKKEIAQQLTYLVCEHASIAEPDEQFSAHCIGLDRSNAYKILEGLEKLGMKIFWEE